MKAFIHDDELVLSVHAGERLPPLQLLGLAVDDRAQEQLVKRRAERRPAVLGERVVEEVTPLAARLLAVRRTLERRDVRAARHQTARQSTCRPARWTHVRRGLREVTRERT